VNEWRAVEADEQEISVAESLKHYFTPSTAYTDGRRVDACSVASSGQVKLRRDEHRIQLTRIERNDCKIINYRLSIIDYPDDAGEFVLFR
jgi:hypothetical protein